MSFRFKIAMGAFNRMKSGAVMLLRIMQDRSSAILVTMCTYPMRWIGSLARFFQCIYVTPIPRSYQLIALLCFFPCFYLSDFFFKLAYSLNHRRLLRLGRYCARLGGQNSALKLNSLAAHLFIKHLLAPCPTSTNSFMWSCGKSNESNSLREARK